MTTTTAHKKAPAEGAATPDEGQNQNPVEENRSNMNATNSLDQTTDDHARRHVQIAGALYKEGIATNDISMMAEAAIEYREILRLLGIDADSGEDL